MEYQVLYRKYRPHDFDSLVGQEYTKKLLKNSVKSGKFAHAYIFTGPRGTGKTSSAKIFAKAINCLNPVDGNPCDKCENCLSFSSSPDIIELDAASNNSVDDIREIINNVRLAPSNMKIKVYIIDEFHMLSTSAFNALLLTLEEPPKDVVFILATTDIQSVPITVLSRCQRFDFKSISLNDIEDRLKYVCEQENIDITDDAIEEIALMSNGGLRDALSILDQLSSLNCQIDVNAVISNFGGVSNKKLKELFSYYENNDIESVIRTVNIFKETGIDIKILIGKIINYLKNILIAIKTEKYNGNLIFDNIYGFIFELNNLLYMDKSSASYYDLLEIVFLKYINYFPGNNFADKKNIKDEKTSVKNEKELSKKIESDTNSNVVLDNKQNEITNGVSKIDKMSPNIDFDIDIRINNTFVNAKKDYLISVKSKWNDFIAYESNANKSLLSYIVDTSIVAVSDKYAILVNNLDSTNDLINQNIKSLEKDFNLFFNKNVYLVSISPKKWENERNKYINNVKNGYKYEIIDNDIIIKENKSELDKIAKEIFGNNYKKLE